MSSAASMDAVLGLAETLNTVSATGELAAVVADLARDALDADSAAVAVLEADGEHLAYLDLAAYLPEQGVAGRWQRLPLAHPSPPVAAVRGAAPVIHQTMAGAVAAHPQVGEDLIRTGYETTANIPLTSGGTVLGLLGVAWDAPHQCDTTRAQLAQALAALSAQALARLRLVEQRTGDARRMAALVEVAQALGETSTRTQVLQVLTTHGIAALGAQGAGLCLPTSDGTEVQVLTSSFFEQSLQARLQTLPSDFPLPIVHAATTGTVHFLPDRAAATALYPQAERIYDQARVEGSAEVPLWSEGTLLGSLSLAFAEVKSWREEEQALAQALAALTAQTLQRLAARDPEVTASIEVRRLSEGLQRSLLTALPEPDHLELVARYVPAAEEVQVGGDWYDVFMVGDGTTCLVIGDVAGHDSDAAVAMAQIRNVLRGIAHAVSDSPAGVLSALDLAVRDLAIGAMATAVLAKVEQDPAEKAAGLRTLRWSSAGHLPPVLIHPDGRVELLQEPSDLMLGVMTGTERQDHTVQLQPGSTVLLYTDGLVERRGEDLEHGSQRLLDDVRQLAGPPLQQLSDELLRRLVTDSSHTTEDDVALLAVRAHPEDRPRPPEAGPRLLPDDLTA